MGGVKCPIALSGTDPISETSVGYGNADSYAAMIRSIISSWFLLID